MGRWTVAVLAALVWLLPQPAQATPIAVGTNWAGFLADAGTDTQYYTGVSASFVQPGVSAHSCLPEADASTWVGLGGFNRPGGDQMLLQVGTSVDHDLTGGTTVWAWYQYLATRDGRQVGGGETTALPVLVRPGDQVRLRLIVAPRDGLAYFEVSNATTGGLGFMAVPLVLAGIYDGSTAEVITERSVRLARFGSVRWSQPQVQLPSGEWHPLATQAKVTRVDMLGAGQRLLAVSTPHPDGFTTAWTACR